MPGISQTISLRICSNLYFPFNLKKLIGSPFTELFEFRLHQGADYTITVPMESRRELSIGNRYERDAFPMFFGLRLDPVNAS
jgi:hypothetical protein